MTTSPKQTSPCGAGNDRDELDRFLPLLGPGDVVADIGANCGLYALLASRRVGAAGRVLAFEPNPVLIERLQFNIGLNSAGNITVLSFALGSESGTATMYVKDRQLGMSGMAPNAKRRPMAVLVRALPGVLREQGIGALHSIKIDVEGYEDRVLGPYLSDTADDRLPRAILMETAWSKRWQADCLDLCQRRGYRPTWRSDMNVLLQRP